MSAPSPHGPPVERSRPVDAHSGRRRNGQLAEVVLELLRESPVPLGAYDIVDQLKGRWHAPIAPMQVYRALRSLRAAGRVHRLASRSAFVVEAGAPPKHGIAVFLVCSVSSATRN
jgi:Fur family zinc uptake transcriptional regulator